MEPKEIKFNADRIRIKTLVDGSFQVILDTGEYEVAAIQEIVGLPRESVYEIRITPVMK